MAIAEAGSGYMRSLFSQPLYMFEMAHNNNNNNNKSCWVFCTSCVYYIIQMRSRTRLWWKTATCTPPEALATATVAELWRTSAQASKDNDQEDIPYWPPLASFPKGMRDPRRKNKGPKGCRKKAIFPRNPGPGVVSFPPLRGLPAPSASSCHRIAQTHIVLRSPAQDAGFALYALPLVGLDCLGHIQSELQASWVTWKKPEATVLRQKSVTCTPSATNSRHISEGAWRKSEEAQAGKQTKSLNGVLSTGLTPPPPVTPGEVGIRLRTNYHPVPLTLRAICPVSVTSRVESCDQRGLNSPRKPSGGHQHHPKPR